MISKMCWFFHQEQHVISKTQYYGHLCYKFKSSLKDFVGAKLIQLFCSSQVFIQITWVYSEQ